MNLVVSLDSPDAAAPCLVGGKAAGLRLLRAAALPCPPGLVVTTEAHRRYVRHVLGPGHVDALVGTSAEAAHRLLRAAHAEHALPRCVAEPLRRALAALPAPHGLAVRSSAVREDGQRRSFAGVHESVLNVTAENVEQAVRTCWASLWSPAAVAYRAADGGSEVSLESEAMAVVVQPLVPAVAAAVVFTTDPVDDPGLVRIEAVRGAGAALVSGEADPDLFLLDRVTLRVVTRRAAVSRVDHAAGPVIGDRFAQLLADLCLRAERAFGTPLDVEAVLAEAEGQSAWTLVQARPITTVGLDGAPPR